MSFSAVVSQPMFFPWVGMFEQLKISDFFIHYDDVKYPQGSSFINRVQVKTRTGVKWITVPIDKKNSGKLISETLISYSEDWRDKHLTTLQHCFSSSRYLSDVLSLVENMYSIKFNSISDLNIKSFEAVAKYFGLSSRFYLSSSLNIQTCSSQKLLDIVKAVGASRYITGLGALNYLDYGLFEEFSVKVEYMSYQKRAYSQRFGEFTPYVTVLDLIANEGKEGANCILSNSVYWRDYLNE